MLTDEENKNNRKDVQILEDSKFICFLLRKYLRYTIKFINIIYTV